MDTKQEPLEQISAGELAAKKLLNSESEDAQLIGKALCGLYTLVDYYFDDSADRQIRQHRETMASMSVLHEMPGPPSTDPGSSQTRGVPLVKAAGHARESLASVSMLADYERLP